MVNVKSKNNARTGGAVTSPNVDFINTGHAAQSRYIAALMNPFSAPAVPIPDSFLKAHCAKKGLEKTLTGAKTLQMEFYKNSTDATGNYTLIFSASDANGGHLFTADTITSSIGTRLVAAGISFEDGDQASDIGGFVEYCQSDNAGGGTTGNYEYVAKDTRTERNYGYGSLTYSPTRRQSLDFEGNVAVLLTITFNSPKDLIVRYAAILETDGDQGFVEGIVAQNDYVITSSMDNHHAGVFGDTPYPKNNVHLSPNLTQVHQLPTHHWTDMWHSAGSWVSSAAGWAWKHKPRLAAWANTAGQIYRELNSFRGSITAARTGEIMSLGARAAPLLLA